MQWIKGENRREKAFAHISREYTVTLSKQKQGNEDLYTDRVSYSWMLLLPQRFEYGRSILLELGS